jgi:signal transduction histidine kinase
MLIGLRGRFVAALLLVSAVTLGVAAVALLSPLQHRLQRDEIDGMVAAVHAEGAAFARIPAGGLVAGSERVGAVARGLHRGSGADVVVVGPRGGVLATTDPDAGRASTLATLVQRSGRAQRDLTRAESAADAQVAVPLTVRGQRIVVVLRKPLQDARAAVSVVRAAFFKAAAIGMGVALLVGLALAGRLVRRLRALRDTALRVAVRGPVDEEMRSDGSRDEVGDLTRAFATMQARLGEQEQARRTFVATASHELRTPLSSLRIMLEMLRTDLESATPDFDHARDQAGRAEIQADRLAQLATQLLDLSRIDAGLPLRAEPVEVAEVVRSVVAEFDERLAGGGRRIAVDAAGGQWVLADPGAVARIVRILLDNALRHTPEGTTVRVQAQRANGRCVLAVRDEGPGVPVDDRARIFERFARGDRSSAPGFGLGLAIGRELARRMGGELSLAAGGEGRGACFVLSLPAGAG